MRNDVFFSVDFETNTTNFYDKYGYVNVWAWNATDINTLKSIETGNSLDGFFNWLLKFKHNQSKKTCYFHNLRFDGSYILQWLFEHKYKHVNDRKNKTKTSFATLISDANVWYSIQIFNDGKTVEIFDSLKKLVVSVAELSRAYGVDECKGEIDYNTIRENGYSITDTERKYIENDTYIVAYALKFQIENGLTKMTTASDALNMYKNYFCSTFDFLRWFPKLTLAVDDYIRMAYIGGYVYLKPEYINVVLKNVFSLDKNSMYPDKMRNYMLPYGIPKQFKGKYVKDIAMPLYVQQITCIFKLKAGYVPTIQLRKAGNFAVAEYAISSNNEPVILTLTNLDLQLFLNHYNVYDIQWLGGYKFTANSIMFTKYVDYYYSIKSNEKGAKRTIAKLMLNSLYGKFGKRLRLAKNIPYFDKIKKVVQFKKGDIEIGDGLYLPVAAFITAYARIDLIASIQDNFSIFVYCDTDSMHTLNADVKNMNIDNLKLGAWKNEGRARTSKYLRAKTYIKDKFNINSKKLFYHGVKVYLCKYKISITCAGMPKNVKQQVDFENFIKGSVFGGKLLQKRVSGGTLLQSTQFTIK